MNWNVKDIIYIVGFLLAWGLSALISYFKVEQKVNSNEMKIRINKDAIMAIEQKISAAEDRTEKKIDDLIKSFREFENTFKEQLTELKWGKQDKE